MPHFSLAFHTPASCGCASFVSSQIQPNSTCLAASELVHLGKMSATAQSVSNDPLNQIFQGLRSKNPDVRKQAATDLRVYVYGYLSGLCVLS